MNPPSWDKSTFISPRSVEVDKQQLRRHDKGGSITLHVRPGEAAIVQGKRKRQGWVSYYGKREMAQRLLKILSRLPKKALVEVWYVEAKTEVCGTIELIEAGLVKLTRSWENQLIIRCGSFEVQLYGWTEGRQQVVLEEAA